MRLPKTAQDSQACKSMVDLNSNQTSLRGDRDHCWDLTPAAAVSLQQRLAGKIIRRSIRSSKNIRTVAGVDCSYQNAVVRAAVVVMRYADLETLAEAVAQQPAVFPYRTGLLAFREGPAILHAFSQLSMRPDLLIFDGQGLAHPRRFGIACHIGLLTGIASIGCAKSRLVGHFELPAATRGSYSLLKDKGETVGAVVRTRTNVAPVFVSIGHGVDLADSIGHVLHCCRGYRLPETTRRADRLAASFDKNRSIT
jgi:deoxyribonuclease V